MPYITDNFAQWRGFGKWVVLPTLTAAMLCLAPSYPAQSASARLENTLAQALEQAATLLKQGKTSESYDMYMGLLGEDPENPLVNLGLAKAATALGEYNQAILALERLVDAYPQDAGLRAELARALFRMDNAEGARREMELAKRMDPSLSDNMAQTVLDRLEKESRRWQVSGRLSAGMVYDSNVNMGPASEFIQLGLWDLRLNSDATGKQSWGTYGMATLDGGWRLGMDSPWWIVGDVAYYHKSYFEKLPANKELSWGRGALGLRYLGHSGLVDLRVKSDLAEYIGDDQAAYATGPELLWAWAVQPNLQLITRAGLERRDYRVDNGRQGLYVWAGEYIRLLFGERGSDIMVGVRWLNGDAKNENYSYHGWETSAQATFRLPWSLELTPFLIHKREMYHGPATALEQKNRQDDNLRVGASLSYFFTPNLSCDLLWQYADNKSTSSLYTYDQYLMNMGLTLRF